MDQSDKAVPIVFISDSRRSAPVPIAEMIQQERGLSQEDRAGIEDVISFLTSEFRSA